MQKTVAVRPARTKVLQRAFLETSTEVVPVQLRNISSSGAMVVGQIRWQVGDDVILRREEASAKGIIAWICQKETGIKFAQPVIEATWLPNSTEIDNIPENQDLQSQRECGDEKSSIYFRVSEELNVASRIIDMVTEKISRNPLILIQLSTEIQLLDNLRQVIIELAKVVGSDDVINQAWKVRVEELRRRLTRD